MPSTCGDAIIWPCIAARPGGTGMGSQMSFGDLESQGQRRKTRREGLPERMDAIVPWDRWCALVEHPFLIVKRRSGHLRTRCRGPRRTPACSACPSPSRTWPCASPREGPSPPGPKLPERLRHALSHAWPRQGVPGKVPSAWAGRGSCSHAQPRQRPHPGCCGAGRALIVVSLGAGNLLCSLRWGHHRLQHLPVRFTQARATVTIAGLSDSKSA